MMITLKGQRILRREVEVEVNIVEALEQMRKEWIARAPNSSLMADYIDEDGYWAGQMGDDISQYRKATKEEMDVDMSFKILIGVFSPKKVLE